MVQWSRTLGMSFFFFFNDTATTEIYTLSLHDALPISWPRAPMSMPPWRPPRRPSPSGPTRRRSEEHTSELQSRLHLVCRLLLEKKKQARHLCTIPVIQRRPDATDVQQLDSDPASPHRH